MKRRDLERHLREQGCAPIREGGNHTIWEGPRGRAPVPRHREIDRKLARAICAQLGVDAPAET
ncbi:MAG TPA: type II toxin-antitoxin system HicA family toxin [Thermoleophilaceae bacterium]|nr:type II toxin-antitoxin system HicA family toxin [Thermoleophilaceae bacterium]